MELSELARSSLCPLTRSMGSLVMLGVSLLFFFNDFALKLFVEITQRNLVGDLSFWV